MARRLGLCPGPGPPGAGPLEVTRARRAATALCVCTGKAPTAAGPPSPEAGGDARTHVDGEGQPHPGLWISLPCGQPPQPVSDRSKAEAGAVTARAGLWTSGRWEVPGQAWSQEDGPGFAGMLVRSRLWGEGPRVPPHAPARVQAGWRCFVFLVAHWWFY